MSKPKENEVYMLIGGADDKCISNGNTWEESKITTETVWCLDHRIYEDLDNSCQSAREYEGILPKKEEK